jgi:uncharacterized repeat protein (TIGR01451 family)
MRRAVILLAVLADLFVTGAAVGAGPLTGSIEVWKVIPAGDAGEESFVSAEKAAPQDVIEYRLTYANKGESALRSISIVDPVPQGTHYVIRTATQPGGAVAAVSVDEGKTFHSWPVRVRKVVDGNEVWVDATPDMVTHSRWTINNELKPAERITLAYRAVVR